MQREIDNVVINGKPLSRFICAYITAALWSSTDDDGEPLDSKYTWQDIHPDALASMILDCEQFQHNNSISLCELTDEQGGVDFWLTRNHHGAGYWDRGIGIHGTRLTDAAHVWGEQNLYIGDDNKLYV